MNITYRCRCTHIIAQLEDDKIYFNRQGFVIVASGPLFIRCAQCQQWYKSTEGITIEPITMDEIATEIGPRCVQCGSGLKKDDGTLYDICPKCGQPRTLSNKRLKQTR